MLEDAGYTLNQQPLFGAVSPTGRTPGFGNRGVEVGSSPPLPAFRSHHFRLCGPRGLGELIHCIEPLFFHLLNGS